MVEVIRSVSPADPADEVGRFAVWETAALDEAVVRARDAFPGWRDAGLEARAAVLRRFAALATERAEDLAQLIAREVGKALWDARSEAGLLAPKVEATLSAGMEFVRPLEGGPGRAPPSTRAACSPCSGPSTSRRISRTATSCRRSRRATASCSSRATSRPRSANGSGARSATRACRPAPSSWCRAAPRPAARSRSTPRWTACSLPARTRWAARSRRPRSISRASCSRSSSAARTA